jgi:hypothetical protein
MDTQFFLQALAEFTQQAVGELTAQHLSLVLRRAQELKAEAQTALWHQAEP